jgi:DNA polymerase-3 subunit epsilon
VGRQHIVIDAAPGSRPSAQSPAGDREPHWVPISSCRRNRITVGADATAAAEIAVQLARKTSSSSLTELAAATGNRPGSMDQGSWSGCKHPYTVAAQSVPPGADPDADPDHPLYGQHIVFTGALAILRKDAEAMVAAAGAVVQRSITKKTTRLVIGDGFTGNTPDESTTSKAREAIERRARGQDIEILTERELIALLAETSTAGTRNAESSTQSCQPEVRVSPERNERADGSV